MAITSLTSATKSLDYNAQGKAININKIGYKVTGKGIVEGGTLTKVDVSTVRLSAFVAILYDPTWELSVREESVATADVGVDPTNCFLIMRENWEELTGSFPQLISTDEASILDTDVIIGRAIFIGGVLQTVFDYTQRDTHEIALDRRTELRITPVVVAGVYQNYVAISAGTYMIDNVAYTYAGGVSGPFGASLGVQSVHIDTGGTISVVAGDQRQMYGKFYLGQVVKTNATRITGNEIAQYTSYFKYPNQFSGYLDKINAISYLTTGNADITGLSLAVGGIALNGGTSTGKLFSLAGTDSGEKIAMYGNGDGVFARDVTVGRNFGLTGSANVGGALAVTGLVTSSGGVTISGGELSVNGLSTLGATKISSYTLYNGSGGEEKTVIPRVANFTASTISNQTITLMTSIGMSIDWLKSLTISYNVAANKRLILSSCDASLSDPRIHWDISVSGNNLNLTIYWSEVYSTTKPSNGATITVMWTTAY